MIMAKEDNAQLLLIGGITICILIILSSAAIVSMSGVNIPIDKTSFIKGEYDNIRSKLYQVLKHNLENRLDDEEYVMSIFNYARDQFSFAEARHDMYFHAEFLDFYYISDQPKGIITKLTLRNNYDVISEEVIYQIE
jgi:hypothetical protein